MAAKRTQWCSVSLPAAEDDVAVMGVVRGLVVVVTVTAVEFAKVRRRLGVRLTDVARCEDIDYVLLMAFVYPRQEFGMSERSIRSSPSLLLWVILVVTVGWWRRWRLRARLLNSQKIQSIASL